MATFFFIRDMDHWFTSDKWQTVNSGHVKSVITSQVKWNEPALHMCQPAGCRLPPVCVVWAWFFAALLSVVDVDILFYTGRATRVCSLRRLWWIASAWWSRRGHAGSGREGLRYPFRGGLLGSADRSQQMIFQLWEKFNIIMLIISRCLVGNRRL